MSKISSEELQSRVKWTLLQKIDHSLGVIDQALSFCDNNAYVSFSGGKDSTVLLSLARIIKPDIRAVFFNTTNEFPEIYKFIKEIDCEKIQPEMNLKSVIAKVGFPLISKEQSQYIREARTTRSEKLRELRLNGRKGNQGKISNKWKHLINAPFDISEKCCFHLKKKPAKEFEKREKLMPIVGTMATESSLRMQKYLKTGCNAFEMARPASYPLSIWNTDDVWQYIRENNIPYCDIYDKGETQTGCMICGFGCQYDSRFKRLEESQPRAYEIGMGYENSGINYKEAIKYTLKK